MKRVKNENIYNNNLMTLCVTIETWTKIEPLHLSHPGLGLAMAVLVNFQFVFNSGQNLVFYYFYYKSFSFLAIFTTMFTICFKNKKI